MLEALITKFDATLRILTTTVATTRDNPSAIHPEATMSHKQKKHTIGLMRINHCGEICAQGLYTGQILATKNPNIRSALQKASDEELEHLAWTKSRLNELGGHTSYLNPIFYLSSIALALIISKVNDGWNMGFLNETELQVEGHLGEHLTQIPDTDQKSRAILEQMKIDERAHAQMAASHSMIPLPNAIKHLMHWGSMVMKKATYYI